MERSVTFGICIYFKVHCFSRTSMYTKATFVFQMLLLIISLKNQTLENHSKPTAATSRMSTATIKLQCTIKQLLGRGFCKTLTRFNLWVFNFDPFLTNAPILYPLKTWKHHKTGTSRGVLSGNIGQKWLTSK